jgi:hypothetical protein
VVIIFMILYFLVALKLLAMTNAIRWILLYGTEYRERMSRTSIITAGERDQILDDCHAGFFPFGVKDYQLSSYLRKPNCRGSKRLTVGFFRKYLFQFPGPAFAGSALLIITAKLPSTAILVGSRAYTWIGAGYGTLLLIVIITFSIEAFLSYAILGSYGTAFHRLDVPRERWRPTGQASPNPRGSEPIVTEMTAYGGILVTGYTAMTSTTYFISVRLGGFANVPAGHGVAFVQLTSLADSLYWTAIIPADLNGAAPIGAFPRIIELLAFVAAFIMITFVVFILGIAIASVQRPPAVVPPEIDKVPEFTNPPSQNAAVHTARAPPKNRVRSRRKRRSRRRGK